MFCQHNNPAAEHFHCQSTDSQPPPANQSHQKINTLPSRVLSAGPACSRALLLQVNSQPDHSGQLCTAPSNFLLAERVCSRALLLPFNSQPVQSGQPETTPVQNPPSDIHKSPPTRESPRRPQLIPK